MNKSHITQFERQRFAELKTRLFQLEKDLKDERHQREHPTCAISINTQIIS